MKLELVAELVAGLTMALNLPIYKRGNSYVLHMRIAGKQIKRSLGTLEPSLAKLRAMQLMGQILAGAGALAPPTVAGWRAGTSLLPDGQQLSLLRTAVTPTNFVQSDASRDSLIGSNQVEAENAPDQAVPPEIIVPIDPQSIARHAHELPSFFAPKKALANAERFKMARIFGEYIEVRKIKDVTKFDYRVYAKEIAQFFKNKDIRLLTEADVNELITHLRIQLQNDARTVDNKVGFLRAVINFLIKQGVFIGANPASAKNLVSKRERRKGGTKPIAYNDLKAIFGDGRFAQMRVKKPEIYLIVMTGLVTGMRVSSVARLQAEDLKISMSGTPYIDISADKTVAGNRDIPIPRILFDALKRHLSVNGGFGLVKRDAGKGFSDAVNKPIKAFLKEHRLDGQHEKLSFHAFRKSFNDHLLRQSVEQYICGAVLGHVDESMTTGVYARTPSVDVLATRIGKHQEDILEYLNFRYT